MIAKILHLSSSSVDTNSKKEKREIERVCVCVRERERFSERTRRKYLTVYFETKKNTQIMVLIIDGNSELEWCTYEGKKSDL